MLEVIRSNAQSWGVKIAFGIIILVFVFWGVGGLTGGPSTVILTVNGEPITIQDFQRRYEQLEQNVRAQNPGLDADQLKSMQLKQRLIQTLVLENLLSQEAKRVGVTVTPVELRKICRDFALGYLDDQRARSWRASPPSTTPKANSIPTPI